MGKGLKNVGAHKVDIYLEYELGPPSPASECHPPGIKGRNTLACG
jgi:hypothetical protein